jgi:hypothetical protein
MKKSLVRTFILLLFGLFWIQSCGPVVVSHRPEMPPPAWYYPNRIQTVRYVFFPDYLIYYDLSMRMYIYFDNNSWIRVKTLPSRYRNLNLRKSRYRRIKEFYGDNISTYHNRSTGRVSRSKSRRRN